MTKDQKKLLWDGNSYFDGLHKFFKHLEEKSYKIQYRVMLSRYRGKTKCPTCNGTRLRKEASFVKIDQKDISQLVDLPINEVLDFFDNIKLDKHDQSIAKRLLKEIITRLQFLKRCWPELSIS